MNFNISNVDLAFKLISALYAQGLVNDRTYLDIKRKYFSVPAR